MQGVSNRVSPWFLVLLVVAVGGGVLTVVGTPALVTSGSTAVFTTGVVLLVLGGWAVSLCLHEFGHAAVAYRGGDLSVRDKGYLTLDIRRYTDLGLSFVLPNDKVHQPMKRDKTLRVKTQNVEVCFMLINLFHRSVATDVEWLEQRA